MKFPFNFGYQSSSAATNYFQQITNLPPETICVQAQQEFDLLVNTLRAHHINVDVIRAGHEKESKDAVYLNNWFSSHEQGTLIIYPMQNPDRRSERTLGVKDYIQTHYPVQEIWDISFYEDQGLYLESTGSVVLDREHRIAYACKSPRTSPEILNLWCQRMDYQPVLFEALDPQGRPFYHTNVIMAMGRDFVILYLAGIPSKQQKVLLASFHQTGKQVIEITLDQVLQFAGNGILMVNQKEEDCFILSTAAYQSLNRTQLQQITTSSKLIHSAIPLIEKIGGGGVRCMIAENFFKK